MSAEQQHDHHEPHRLPSALDLALDWAQRVADIAAHRRGPEAGKAQFEAAQMASCMALVSLAEDVRRITVVLLQADTALELADARELSGNALRRWARGESLLEPEEREP